VEAEGVTVHTTAHVRAVAARDGLEIVTATTADDTFEVAAEEMLVAVGHTPNVEEQGLDAAHAAYDPSAGIAVDASLRTTNRRTSAAGDVRGAPFFTHAAAQQARLAARNALAPLRTKLDHRVLPWTTFSDPEVATSG
jgi:pyruvate/2-oxoglutarate dehydrogenase complex dihydrolipoamide dehydrogenase (E3) component